MQDIKAVLFDLDGTLLPLDFEEFFPRYLAWVRAWYLTELGRDITEVSLACAARMIANDGNRSNADVFWTALAGALGCDRARLEAAYGQLVACRGAVLADEVEPDPEAPRVVRRCRELGLRVALATNPVFPQVMIEERLRWARLATNQFDLVTSAERMHFCKPKPEYYLEVARELGVRPEQCVMIGNDMAMDLVPAGRVGMHTCLLQNEFIVPGDGTVVPDELCTLDEVPALLASWGVTDLARVVAADRTPPAAREPGARP